MSITDTGPVAYNVTPPGFEPGEIEQLAAAALERREKPAKKPRTRPFLDANALLDQPDPVWLVPGILEENSFGMVWGLPGCFKTFLALDLALSLAHGLPFLGHFETAGEYPVAYITPEGSAGIKRRLRAWMDAKGIDRLRNVTINRHAFRLNEPEEVDEVIKAVRATGTKPKVIFVDTLARNFAADENSTKDMSAFVNHVTEIGQELGCAVIVVHHSGKDSAKGARGSIALTGGVDLSIQMVKPDGGRTATVRCHKQKEAEEFAPFVVTAHPSAQSLTLTYDPDAKPEATDALRKPVTVADFIPVLSVLPDGEADALTVAAVAKAAGLPVSTTRHKLGTAAQQGWATKLDGPVRYFVTARGKAMREGNQLVG